MRHRLLLLTLISLFLSSSAIGQKLVNTPFSRFNIGSMEPAGSFRSLGMGGVGISLRDNSAIYFGNPASYSSLDTNSFIFDFGLDYSMNFISDGTSDFSSDDMNFDHLLIGFPLSKKIGFAAGIIPLSNGYYQLEETVSDGDPGYDPLTGGYTTLHYGEGGFTNFFMGTGVSVTKNLSAGVNMTILFGQVKRTNQFEFSGDDYYNVFNNKSTEKYQIGGVNFEYGLQYSVPFKEVYFFNAGVSVSSPKYYNSKFQHLSQSYTAYNTRDTISYVEDDSTKTYLPGALKFGLSIGKKNKFTAGIDFIYSMWNDAIIPGSIGYAADTKSVLFGAEFIPDKFSNYSFLKRLEYRLGGHIGDNYLIIDGQQIKEIGGSVGIGIPMRKSLSKTNLFFDFTRKSGSISNILHSENYYTMGISLNLYDFWFRKRKYE